MRKMKIGVTVYTSNDTQQCVMYYYHCIKYGNDMIEAM